MPIELLQNLDANRNQILDLRVEVLASDPTGGDLYEGRVWYNSTSDQYKGYANGTVVILQQAGASGVSSLTVDDASIEDIGTAADPSIRVKALGVTNAMLAGSIDNAKLATNPLARANHTGTQLAATVSDFDTQVRTSRLDQMAAPTASVVLNSQKITSLANGTADTDAATVGQVNAAGSRKTVIARAASTANVVIASALENGDALDGVTLATGDIAFLKNQTAPEENGLYSVVASGAASRTPEYNTSAEMEPGLTVIVNEGTANADTEWRLTTNAPITLNTTALTFTQIPTTDVTAGAGLTRTGNTLDVGAGTGITVNANDVALSVPVTIANGGTGQTTAAAALAALGGTTKFSDDVGDGAATAYVITHNLNSRDVVVSVRRSTTPWDVVLCDVEMTSVNTVTLRFAVAPTTDQYRVTIVG